MGTAHCPLHRHKEALAVTWSHPSRNSYSSGQIEKKKKPALTVLPGTRTDPSDTSPLRTS